MIGLSRELSATIQSAETGAKESGVNIPIQFVDSCSASMGEGINVLVAAQMLIDNPQITLDELARKTNEWAGRTRVFGALDTLENLKKGGRVSGAKAFLHPRWRSNQLLRCGKAKLWRVAKSAPAARPWLC